MKHVLFILSCLGNNCQNNLPRTRVLLQRTREEYPLELAKRRIELCLILILLMLNIRWNILNIRWNILLMLNIRCHISLRYTHSEFCNYLYNVFKVRLSCCLLTLQTPTVLKSMQNPCKVKNADCVSQEVIFFIRRGGALQYSDFRAAVSGQLGLTSTNWQVDPPHLYLQHSPEQI